MTLRAKGETEQDRTFYRPHEIAIGTTVLHRSRGPRSPAIVSSRCGRVRVAEKVIPNSRQFRSLIVPRFANADPVF